MYVAQRSQDPVDRALLQARDAYVAGNQISRATYEAAQQVMPGGNTRSSLFYEPFPLSITHGEGCAVWDADGHRYVDMLGEFTAGLYGHSNPIIRKAINQALDKGVNLGGHTLLEPALAGLICERFPSIKTLRFTNSGTEANLMALAAAKAFTGRQRILVFVGAYHGSVLTFAEGMSPANVPHEFVLAPYNDPTEANRLIAAHGEDLAAVLVEPMLGAGGCIPAAPDFLFALRKATQDVGALLVLDEVMTSRTSAGGRQALLGLVPDLTTLGKYVGGGMSFGAFGGREEIMAIFDPRRSGSLPHAGTFNNNVLTMSAGIAGLTHCFTASVADRLRESGEALRAQLNGVCRAADVSMQFTGLGSIMGVHFTDQPVLRPSDTAQTDKRLKELFFFDMLADGF